MAQSERDTGVVQVTTDGDVAECPHANLRLSHSGDATFYECELCKSWFQQQPYDERGELVPYQIVVTHGRKQK